MTQFENSDVSFVTESVTVAVMNAPSVSVTPWSNAPSCTVTKPTKDLPSAPVHESLLKSSRK